MDRRLVACLAPLLAATALAGASGTVRSGAGAFRVADGYAYEGTAQFGGDTVVRVELFDHALDRKALDAVLDVKAELERQRSEAGYVVLEFETDGAWTGGTGYDIAGGSGCAWCLNGELAARATTKVADGRLVGSVKVTQDDWGRTKAAAIDVTLDLAVAKGGGTPLPASGGDPAKALAACRDAVSKKDEAGVAALCFAADDPRMTPAARATDEGFWQIVRQQGSVLALDEYAVSGGRTKGDWAELSVTGKGGGHARTGSVFMRKTAAGWRFDHEDLSISFE